MFETGRCHERRHRRGGAATVTVFEKESTVGGRTATRRRHGCRYDDGAAYCKDEGSVGD